MPFRPAVLIAFATLLSACQWAARPEPRECFGSVPVAVKVPWMQFAPMPSEFTDPLPKEQPANDTCGEAVRVAHVRGETVDMCNDHRARVRALGQRESEP
ncbi:MAG TPA: hypothetical protein VJ724_06040 [Tahibacter sp.]|jgi:hypothetical protein|nr:hypothetical protein [Tahibacter sp.]